MFEVRTCGPMDAKWRERDEQLRTAAGRESDYTGADCGSGHLIGIRGHGWDVATFMDAMNLKAKLETVPGVTVTIREK